MEESDNIFAEIAAEPGEEGEQNKHPEAFASFARSDSGKGKSLTSQDLGDEDVLPDQHTPERDMIESPPALGNSQNCTTDSGNAVVNSDGLVQGTDSSVNSLDSSTNAQRPARKMERQTSIDIQQDIIDCLLRTPPLNPHSIELGSHILAWSGLQEGVIGPHAVSVQTIDESFGNSDHVSDPCTQSTVEAAPYDPQPNSSSDNVQLNTYDNSGSADANVKLGHHNLQRSSSVPATAAPFPFDISQFSSFPVSHAGLVPKGIMDNLVKELVRERWKVDTLLYDNDQLRQKVTEFEERHQTDTQIVQNTANRYSQLRTEYTNNISCVSQQTTFWKQKLERKEKELDLKLKELEDVNTKNDELTHENQNLKRQLDAEQIYKKRLENLESTLKNERSRFNRDEKTWKSKMKVLEVKMQDLKEENQWINEQLDAHEGTSSEVMPEEFRNGTLSYRHHHHSLNGAGHTHLRGVYPELNHSLQESIHSLNGSGETHVKGVYPENSAQPNHSVHQRQGARPKQTVGMSNGVKSKTSVPSLEEEKCANCYCLSSEFETYALFLKHKNKCAP